MQTKSLIAAMLAAALSTSVPAQGKPTLDEADHAYYLGQYSRSLELYQRLAEAGNAEAAERAGFMLFHGAGLYHRQVTRDPRRAMPLLEQAARAGRPGAGFILSMVELAD